MGRIENLTPLNKRDPEEARAIRAAGGRAAAKAKARNNKLRSRVEYMLKQQSGWDHFCVASDWRGAEHNINTDGSYYDRMVASLISKACHGDMKAIQQVLDILGDDTKDEENEES